MTVEIVEVIRRSEQGMTKPFICRGDDGQTYFVKGLDAGRDSQINEWVAGNLAKLIGLPIAPFEIVNIPDELLEFEAGIDLTGLGAGSAFGSKEQSVAELNFTIIDEIPFNLQQDVFIFDWWIRNGDRYFTEKG